MRKEIVEIAVTNYNNEKYLVDCISSIKNQTYYDWIINFVDDNSSDNSLKEIEKISNILKIENKINIYKNNKNLGYGYSLKKAIELSKNNIIFIIDADDALASNNAIEKMLNIHLNNKDVSLVYSRFWLCDKNLDKISISKKGPLPKGKSFLEIKSGVSHLKSFKKEFYNRTEGIDDNLRKSVDKQLILLLERVSKFYFIDEPLYLYRQHPKSITSIYSKKGLKEQCNIIRKQIFEKEERIRKNKNI